MTLINEALTFDDVLLLPRYSEVLPNEVRVSTFLTSKLKLNIPIISAAMDTVTEVNMAIAIAKLGGIGIIHKNMSYDIQASQIAQVKAENLIAGAAVGISSDTKERVKALVKANVDVIVVDTAHGHSKPVIEVVKWIKDTYPNAQVIAGNIGTAQAAIALKDAGADAVKVGLGPGSICTTRIISGVGVPQITAILNVVEALKDSEVKIIADGGIRYSGDITKALAAGADAVMLGSLLAGTDESPGDTIIIDGKKLKLYRGMGSLGAISESADRYFQHNVSKSKLVPEGVEGSVPYKGAVSDIVVQLTGGLCSGMGYLGCATLGDLHCNAEFVRITGAGIKESHVHNISITKEAPNYFT